MIPRLVVASKNLNKVREMEEVLATTGVASEIVKGLDWPDVAETGETIEDNARLKGRAVVEATGLPVIADDTALEVDALDGRPGVRSSRFAGEHASDADNLDLLLEKMAGIDDRGARFRTVVALVFPDGAEITAEGILDGVITERPRGSHGFGYDPVFEVGGRTLGEMTLDEKTELSHRARAIRALARSLGL